MRVTSTGPYRGDRTLDVSRATAQHLGFLKQGVAQLEVVVLKSPEEHEARYKKLRAYTPVPGFIGTFANFESAHDAAIARLQLDAARVTVAATPDSGEKSAIDRMWPRGLAMEVAGSSYAVATGGAELSAHAAVGDAGPLTALIATDASDAAIVEGAETPPAYSWGIPAEFKASLIERVLSFIDAARSRARLRRTDEATADYSALPHPLHVAALKLRD